MTTDIFQIVVPLDHSHFLQCDITELDVSPNIILTLAARRVPHTKQDLISHPKHRISQSTLVWVRIARSFIFYVVSGNYLSSLFLPWDCQFLFDL